ncbi:Tify domain binding domain [Dillenia turbinata]|uniref:Tify domain binding domain n=1 Tax=Dillenia turbinata TaxID=194707 RepID=A0AAN8VGN2_9MAGN
MWMQRDAGCLTDGAIAYNSSSRIEPKRGHQWLMDATESEPFCNKKHAMENLNSRPISGISNMNVSPWENPSNFQSVSGQFSDRLFGSESIRTMNLVDRTMPTFGAEVLNMGRKGYDDQFRNDSSAGLSMSHSMEDPASCLNYGGIRKVKVNQVQDSDNGMSVAIEQPHSRVHDSHISMGSVYSKCENTISLSSNYDNGTENSMSVGPAFNKSGNSFISMGHIFNKGDGSFISMGQNYHKEDGILSMGQSFDKVDGNFITMGSTYEKEDGNIMSIGAAYGKGPENFIPMGPTFSKANESYDKMNDSIMTMGQAYSKADNNMVSMGLTYDKGDSSILSMGQKHHKVESNTISFGGFQDEPDANPTDRVISCYDLLMSQHSAQASEAVGQKDLVDSNADPSSLSVLKPDNGPKNKELKTSKKVVPNNFPSNVKSLLSTGILDEVPVKYVSWSREKNLQGIIKGTAYLCGCKECGFSKSLNAYEFERHAGCKTKHPNNHIYFENGKTIYAVVQELKNTPQEKLFEAIQTVTGSPINQKNFRIWKASYQAATRELQRIYGKDEIIMPL